MAVQRLTRTQWGAAPAKRPPTPMPTAGGVTIHYEGPTMGAYSHSTCIGKVRGIQRFHMANVQQGWKDVAYNEIVCRHGVRFECRGYGVKSGANGNGAANAGSYSICAMVGDKDEITPELVVGLADAAADYRRHGAGPRVWGHRDHIATACPGNPLYALVNSGAFSSNTPVPEEDDMPSILDFWTAKLTKKGTTLGKGEKGQAEENEAPLDILTRMARNIETVAVDARTARALSEEQAKTGRALTDEEIQRIAEATAREVGEGFTVEGAIVPKDGAQ